MAKAKVSVDFLAALMHAGASRSTIQELAEDLDTIDVFEAYRKGDITAEAGSLILAIRRHAKTPWFVRVWEAIWF